MHISIIMFACVIKANETLYEYFFQNDTEKFQKVAEGMWKGLVHKTGSLNQVDFDTQMKIARSKGLVPDFNISITQMDVDKDGHVE